MTRRVLQMASAVFLFAALALAVTAPAHAQDAAALFKTKCAACHSADGSGSSAMGKQLGVTDLRADDNPETNRRAVERQHNERERQEDAGV